MVIRQQRRQLKWHPTTNAAREFSNLFLFLVTYVNECVHLLHPSQTAEVLSVERACGLKYNVVIYINNKPKNCRVG